MADDDPGRFDTVADHAPAPHVAHGTAAAGRLDVEPPRAAGQHGEPGPSVEAGPRRVADEPGGKAALGQLRGHCMERTRGRGEYSSWVIWSHCIIRRGFISAAATVQAHILSNHGCHKHGTLNFCLHM